jgi:hypothetical protein
MTELRVPSWTKGAGSLAEGSAEYSVRARLLRCVLLCDIGEVGSEVVCVPLDTPFSAIVTEFA